jgi:hypothetical protein
MCLHLKSDQVQNEKDLNRWFGNRKKFAYVYKRLRKHNYESFYRSPIYEFVWDFKKKKVFEIDRSSKPTKFELETATIRKAATIRRGFHVYISLEMANREKIYSNEVITKFRVYKDDIVAIENGRACKGHNFKELVCKRLEFVRVL